MAEHNGGNRGGKDRGGSSGRGSGGPFRGTNNSGGDPREFRSREDRDGQGSRPPFGDRQRPQGDDRKPPFGGGDRDRKPFGDRPRREGDGERRSFGGGDRDGQGSRPPSGDRQRPQGDRDRKPFGDRPRREGDGERRSFGGGDRDGQGSRPPFGDRQRPQGDRDRKPPFGDRDRKPFGDRPRREGDGERRSFGGGENRKPFGDRQDRAPRTFDRGDSGPRQFGRRDEAEQRPVRVPNARDLRSANRPDRERSPQIDEDVTGQELDRATKHEIKTLEANSAEWVARHLVMAGRLIDDEPELAFQHALAASRRGGRLSAVREAVGLTAYAAGHYGEALREFRTYRRISGSNVHLPVMADCERGLGRPDRALDVVRSEEAKDLDAPGKVELAIVAAGARTDLGQLDAAVAELEIPQLDMNRAFSYSPRLFRAYADALAAVGRGEEAEKWQRQAVVAENALGLGASEEPDIIDLGWDEEEEARQDEELRRLQARQTPETTEVAQGSTNAADAGSRPTTTTPAPAELDEGSDDAESDYFESDDAESDEDSVEEDVDATETAPTETTDESDRVNRTED